jgi:hypothetical protein
MQTRKIKESSMSVPPMPDLARPSSTKMQYKTTESADLHADFCTTKPETIANSRDPGPISLPEPHAFLAGHLQDAGSIHPRAVKKENSKILQRTDTTTAVSATEPETAANIDETAETALLTSSAFLAGLRRTSRRPIRCATRSEHASSTPPSVRPPTPSSSSDMNSAAPPRKAIQGLLHTLPDCCDGQQRTNSDALHARPPVTMRAPAYRVTLHMMMKMTTIVTIMMKMMIVKITAKTTTTPTSTTVTTLTLTDDNSDDSSHSPRSSSYYRAQEPKPTPDGPAPEPAADCTRTCAAQVAPPAPLKLSELGTISRSSATETA